MAAFLMAVWFRGLDAEETVALTEAMLRSGDQLVVDDLGGPTADKHSTGGVGDKVSLLLAPAGGGVRAPRADAVRPRPRSHGRHPRQARGHS